jgi:hypothetical protein
MGGTISGGSNFTLDLFISNSADITTWISNYVRNGILLYVEGNTREAMVLRIHNSVQINSNTFRLTLSVLLSDTTWLSGIGSVYTIPSNSYFVQ